MAEQPGRGVVLIAVGDEVLGGFIVDTNSHWLAGRMREAGFVLRRIEVVGDVTEDIAEAVRRAIADAEIARVVVSGGLGPTPDDRTLEAVALGLDVPLEEHPQALAHVQGIVDRIHAAGWIATAEISKANRKMTLAPRGATILNNRRGMASGIAVPLDAAAERWLLLLPGVPRELHSLVDEEAIPLLFAGAAAPTVVELVYRYAIEAQFTEPMEELGRLFPDVKVGSYPQSERRELVIRLRGDDPISVAAAVARMQALRPLEREEGQTG
jgi:molybdenum cofactor synthesis domain-containing protein